MQSKDFRAILVRRLTAATAAITLAFLFAMYWEGFTLAVCYVLKSDCTDKSLLITWVNDDAFL